jgi:hypothetical protein
MEFVPKHLVAGMYLPQSSSPGSPVVTMEKLNMIWSQVSPVYDYRQLQVAADRSAGAFIGVTEEDRVTIQPPLVQVRTPIDMTARKAAEKAKHIVEVISGILGVSQFYNLGIRFILHCVVPGGDSNAAILHRVMEKEEKELLALRAGGDISAGVRFFVNPSQGVRYVITIEPLFAQPSFLFLDLDAAFDGPVGSPDSITERADEVEEYLRKGVGSFLDQYLQSQLQ